MSNLLKSGIRFTIFRQFDRYHSTFVLKDIQHTDFILTDHLAIHFLELPKFRNTRDDKILKIDKLLEKWLYYLKHEGRTKEDKVMEILLKDDETFRIAHEKYLEFTQDDEMVEAYESHMKWVRDYNTKVSFAMEDGIKLGMEKGLEQGLEKGELIGRIQLIQQILQQPVFEKDKLLEKSIIELQSIFSSLEKELMSV